MTTLTPRTPEQCALIDEAARQAKSGELDAKYWEWGSIDSGVFYGVSRIPVWLPERNYRCRPAPAHPHYAKFKEWQALVDAGAVGRGEYLLLERGDQIGTIPVVMNYGIHTIGQPKWKVDLNYVIHKTDKHPDNCKPALKLIDWSKLVGCNTSEGTLLGIDKNGNASIMRMVGVFPKCMVVPTDTIKLAPQTEFTHLQDGETPPVIEGIVIEYEYINSHKFRDIGESPNCLCCIGYRIIGVDTVNGWTDDPSKAAS